MTNTGMEARGQRLLYFPVWWSVFWLGFFTGACGRRFLYRAQARLAFAGSGERSARRPKKSWEISFGNAFCRWRQLCGRDILQKTPFGSAARIWN